jgi:hypothetical protein
VGGDTEGEREKRARKEMEEGVGEREDGAGGEREVGKTHLPSASGSCRIAPGIPSKNAGLRVPTPHIGNSASHHYTSGVEHTGQWAAPAAAAVELRRGLVQRRVARHARVHAVVELVGVLARERPLGALLAQHAELRGR